MKRCRFAGSGVRRLVGEVMSDLTKVKVNYFCLGAIFIFVGSVLLCALGFTIVLPFEVTRSWPQVICYVVNSSYDPNVCSCDDQLNVFDTCVSKYPCLQIHVSYQSDTSIAHNLTVIGADEHKPTLTLSISEEDHSRNSSELNESMQPAEISPLRIRSGASDSKTHLGNFVTSSASPLKNYKSSDEDDARTRSLTTSNNFSPPTLYANTFSTISDIAKQVDVFSGIRSAEADLSLRDDGGASVKRLNDPHSSNSSHDLPRASRLRSTETDKKMLDVVEPSADVKSQSAKLYRSWDDSFHVQCSMTECGDETWNVKESRTFKTNWGRIGKSFPCFYNPDKPEMVIIEKTAPSAAIHAVVWPALCLLAGILLWMGLCMGCWSLKSDSAYRDDSGPLYS